MGPNDGPEELHILGAITNRNTRIAIKAIMNWNVTYRFAARPRESSRLSSGCCRRGAKSSFSSFAFACSNSDSVSAPDDLKSARRCSSSDSDIFVVGLTVLFTNAFGLHQLTNRFVFQYKPNPEGRFSASLGHVYPLGRR